MDKDEYIGLFNPLSYTDQVQKAEQHESRGMHNDRVDLADQDHLQKPGRVSRTRLRPQAAAGYLLQHGNAVFAASGAKGACSSH